MDLVAEPRVMDVLRASGAAEHGSVVSLERRVATV